MPNRMETPWDRIPDFVKENLRKEPHDEVAARLETRVASAEADAASVTPDMLERMRDDADKLPVFGRYENLVLRVHRLVQAVVTNPQTRVEEKPKIVEKKAA